MKLKSLIIPSILIGAIAHFTQHISDHPTSVKQDTNSNSYAAIDAYLQQQMRRLNIPGMSLAIVEGEQIVHMRGFGRANPSDEKPGPQTPFFIGSVTKSFTALAVMQLVEAGKIDLEASVQQYLPWFQGNDRQKFSQITIRHLLNQTSGLPLIPGWQLLNNFDDRPGATERQLRGIQGLALKRSPGTAYEYSNLNYMLLGLVIEAASGELYADYVQQKIFDPLEMRHSYTSKKAAKQNGLAVGHLSWFGIPIPAPDLPIPIGSLPAGYLISCAEDLGHYLIAQLNQGLYRNVQMLSSAAVQEMHRPAASAGVFLGNEEFYGMGWTIEKLGQTTVVWHSGLVPDFYAYIALLPEQKKGLALLINMDHFTMQLTMKEVGMGMTSLLAGQSPPALKLAALPWVQRGLLLIPLIQAAEVYSTLRLLRRWRRDPAQRPRSGRLWGQYILLPNIPHFLLSLSTIPFLGKLGGFLKLFLPDGALITIGCGSFSAIWACLRTRLILKTMRGTIK